MLRINFFGSADRIDIPVALSSLIAAEDQISVSSRIEHNMIRKTRLFTPGPTPLLPAAQFAMAAADMHHRTPEFRALFQRCWPS
jgi:hypothetical protein